MDLRALDGTPFTIWLTDEADESALFSGTARWDGSVLRLERGTKLSFEIRPEWYERIQQVTNQEARRILLGAEHFVHLYVGNLPNDVGASEYEKTGLKWPD